MTQSGLESALQVLTSNATFLCANHCRSGLRTFNNNLRCFRSELPVAPYTIVVPFAAGGPTDTLARILAQRMTVSLGQSVIIENVTGAAGSIAVARVVRSSPDGYTLSIGHVGTRVLNGAIC